MRESCITVGQYAHFVAQQFATVPLSIVIKPISVPLEMHPRGCKEDYALLQISHRSNFLLIERAALAAILSGTSINIQRRMVCMYS